MSNSLQAHGLQRARLPCPSLSPRVCWNLCPLSRWCHSTISSCHALLLLLSIFPSIRVFSIESAVLIRWLKYWSFSFSINPSNEYSGLISLWIDWFGLLAVQESSPAPQFKGINSSVVCLFYGPALTPVHDYWRNHSFDYIDLSPKKRCTELWVKFYLRQNEDCNPGGSTSDSSERLLQSGSGEKSIYKVLVKGEFNTIKHLFYEEFVARTWCHNEGI